jgi:hypothetical protein
MIQSYIVVMTFLFLLTVMFLRPWLNRKSEKVWNIKCFSFLSDEYLVIYVQIYI